MKTTVRVAIVLIVFASGPAAAEEPEGWYLDGPSTLPELHQGPFPTGFDCLRARDLADSVLAQKHIDHQPLQCSYLDKYYWLVETAEIVGEMPVSGPYTTLDKCLEARAKQPGADKPSPQGSLYHSYDCVRHYPKGQ
jgi:hypothetical protein